MTRLESELWTRFMSAAVGGMLASESNDFNLGHRADVASYAATVADYALAEWRKRNARKGDSK